MAIYSQKSFNHLYYGNFANIYMQKTSMKFSNASYLWGLFFYKYLINSNWLYCIAYGANCWLLSVLVVITWSRNGCWNWFLAVPGLHSVLNWQKRILLASYIVQRWALVLAQLDSTIPSIDYPHQFLTSHTNICYKLSIIGELPLSYIDFRSL